MKKCTGKKTTNYGVANIPCPFGNCKSSFPFKVHLYEHLYIVHKADLKPPEIHTFDSFDDFEKWKTDIEDQSYSHFSQQYGKRNGRIHYYCQHDGSNKNHSKNQEPRKTKRRNKKGRIKLNELCLAMMSLTCLESGKIQVAYRPTHLHPCRPKDLKHQPLSKATNDYISKQLAWNVPPRKIVQNLRDDSYKRENRHSRTFQLKRDNLVKVKTIAERMRKKRVALRYSNNDAESVQIKVQVLMKEKYNPILVYKPLGEKTVFGPEGSENLPEDVFLLAFQTEEQLEMMKEGCTEILVVDETHSTNPYGFRLLNLMVRDKYNLGYPVGHAISSHSDEKTLQFVFKAIKERCPDLEINCCITDDDPALINSLNSGMPERVWHLLCIWHIHRTIQTKLREHIKDSELVSEIYDIICVLIDEENEEQFIKLKDSFLLEYSSKCPKFIKYFDEIFFPKAHKWAKCYRSKHHGNTETTMLVESFHNILKTVYMKRAPCKRIDDLIDILFTIEEDYFSRYYNAILLECMSDKDHTDLCSRHERGMKISDCDVTQISSNHWKVSSQDSKSKDDTSHDIVKCADVCSSDSCIFVCCYCDRLCSHSFTCSCPDMFPLCKHLHKLFSIIATQQPEPAPAVEEVQPEFFTVENEMIYIEETGQHVNRPEGNMLHRIQKIREVMKEFDDKYLDNSPVKKHMLPRIETTLLALQAQCKLLCEDRVPVAAAAMDVKIQTAPNEKLQKQLKPFVKKSRKKKKTGLQRTFGQSAIEIKNFLLQDQDHNIDSDLASVSEEQYEAETEPNQTDANVVTEEDFLISNPRNTLKEYQGIKVSSLHLKALDTSAIESRELQCLLQSDPKFVHGWLYDEVINIFFKMLGNENVFAWDTTVAVRLYLGNLQYKNFPSKLSSKAVILFPGNLTDDHWVIISVEVSSCCMWFYDPSSSQGSLLSQSDKKFLGAVALFLRNVFPTVKSWSVKRHFDVQGDLVSCGVHICWFGYCWSTKSNVTPLEDVSQFRKSIYNTIVSLID